AEVSLIGAEPNGLNINDGCGSTAPERLREAVVAKQADVGIALDGDGDRCIMVDHAGGLVDGDQLLYAIAMDRHKQSQLTLPVVGTQMSNLGLELTLKANDLSFERARVGDRYVFERLVASGANIGGESSGHILCLDRASTGDGIVSALQVLAAMKRNDASLSALVEPVEKCPQSLINVRVDRSSATRLMADQAVVSAIRRQQDILGTDARILLRPSGTEPLLRVMVEGMDATAVEQSAHLLAETVGQIADSYQAQA